MFVPPQRLDESDSDSDDMESYGFDQLNNNPKEPKSSFSTDSSIGNSQLKPIESNVTTRKTLYGAQQLSNVEEVKEDADE